MSPAATQEVSITGAWNKELVHIRIILASSSPRRRELLRMAGLSDFDVIIPGVDENAGAEPSPQRTAQGIAEKKCAAVASGHPDALVIAADTIVHLDGVLLGKPGDRNQARSFLERLSGRTHTVYTGVALQYGERRLSAVEGTDVLFRTLADEEIRDYVDSGEPKDKAGGYGIQGRGALFVRRIDGDFYNVMGLPLCRLSTMLRDMGVKLF